MIPLKYESAQAARLRLTLERMWGDPSYAHYPRVVEFEAALGHYTRELRRMIWKSQKPPPPLPGQRPKPPQPALYDEAIAALAHFQEVSAAAHTLLIRLEVGLDKIEACATEEDALPLKTHWWELYNALLELLPDAWRHAVHARGTRDLLNDEERDRLEREHGLGPDYDGFYRDFWRRYWPYDRLTTLRHRAQSQFLTFGNIVVATAYSTESDDARTGSVHLPPVPGQRRSPDTHAPAPTEAQDRALAASDQRYEQSPLAPTRD